MTIDVVCARATCQPAPAVKSAACADIQTTWAAHCAASSSLFLKESPLHVDKPRYDTPSIALGELIEHLLRRSPAPLSAALASLTLIHWITESGSCPLASSSPHHLFCSTYLTLVRLWTAEGGEDWATVACGSIPMGEVEDAKQEVLEFCEGVDHDCWDLVRALLGTDKFIDELFDLERQCEEESESGFFDSMEEELVSKGLLKFEDADDDVSCEFDSVVIDTDDDRQFETIAVDDDDDREVETVGRILMTLVL